VTDFLEEGQTVRVKVLDVDQRGRIKLSIKELLEDEAAEAEVAAEAPAESAEAPAEVAEEAPAEVTEEAPSEVAADDTAESAAQDASGVTEEAAEEGEEPRS